MKLYQIKLHLVCGVNNVFLFPVVLLCWGIYGVDGMNTGFSFQNNKMISWSVHTFWYKGSTENKEK